MPRVSNFEILDRNEQPSISIRTRTKVTDLVTVIGEGYAKLGAYLQESGKFLADAPYVAYYNMDMQDMDIEMGFPLAAPLPGKGDIKASSTPEGKIVMCMYRGPYHETGPVYKEMMKWMEANGLKPVGTAYEYYCNSPADVPENELLTLMAMPIV